MSRGLANYSSTNSEKWDFLITKESSFQKFRDCDTNITPEVREACKRVFETEYPDESFEDFVTPDETSEDCLPEETPCNTSTFDPRVNSYYRLETTGLKRNRKQEFDIVQFLRRCEARGDLFRLTMDDEDVYDDSWQDKRVVDMNADAQLRKLAEFIKILNQTFEYRIADVQGESRIR